MLKKKKRGGKFRLIRLNNGGFLPVILYAALSALMFILLFFHVRPESLDLDLFSISENTIYAPATVEDQKATANKKQEAREEVPDQYTLKKEYSDNRVDLVSSIFDIIKEVKKESAEQEKKDKQAPSEKDQIKSVEEKLTSDVTDSLSQDSVKHLLRASDGELS